MNRLFSLERECRTAERLVRIGEAELAQLRENYRNGDFKKKIELNGRIARMVEELKPLLSDEADKRKQLIALKHFSMLVKLYPPPGAFSVVSELVQSALHKIWRKGPSDENEFGQSSRGRNYQPAQTRG